LPAGKFGGDLPGHDRPEFAADGCSGDGNGLLIEAE
jgi:hypothetical protein